MEGTEGELVSSALNVPLLLNLSSTAFGLPSYGWAQAAVYTHLKNRQAGNWKQEKER